MRTVSIALLTLAFLLPGPLAAREGEPTVAGRIALLKALREARVVCAGVSGPGWQRCVERESAAELTAIERMAGTPLYAGPHETGEAQTLVLDAMQAAYADCRGRGIQRGTVRWDFCTIERGIMRLEEAGGR